jgi:hypothetical protein
LNANGTTGAGNARNMPIGQSLLPGEVQCGYWDRTTSFQTPATSGPENAVRVTFQKPSPTLLPQLFTGDRRIAISAVAALSAPVASFSVGTKLVVVKDDSLLGRALKAIGLDLKGSLAGYDGLAQVKITPTGLLEAFDIKVSADIGVGELNALLNAKTIKLSELLDATARAVGMEELLNANIDLLKAINAKVNIGDPDVRLGSLLQITGPDGPAGSALTTGINALDIFTTSIGIATQKHAIAINDLSAAGLVKARVALIEPPSIAVGGIGATAYTGQLRTFVQIGTGNIPIVGSIINLNLPIMIDAVNGKGTLTEMCTPELRTPAGIDRARIAVQASILKVCVGKPGANPANEEQIFSTSASCDTDLQKEQLLNVSLLGATLVSLNTKLDIDALPLPPNSSVTLAASETATLGNDLLVGTTLKNITNALLASLLANSMSQSPALNNTQLQAMAKDLWGTPPCADSACRVTRLKAVNTKITAAADGLGGFLGNLSTDTMSVLNQLLTLNVAGLVSGILNLVGGLLNGVGNVLGDILGGLFGNQCTGGGLSGAGTDTGCLNEIANSLKNSSSSGSSSVPNAVISLVGFVLQLLQPVLDNLGSQILTPLLQQILGLHLGQIDINLRTLDCNASPSLVY